MRRISNCETAGHSSPRVHQKGKAYELMLQAFKETSAFSPLPPWCRLGSATATRPPTGNFIQILSCSHGAPRSFRLLPKPLGQDRIGSARRGQLVGHPHVRKIVVGARFLPPDHI